ncbi:uncharacterized protein LOC143017595 [Oratosquilla oratoria]|uniref:uncharacterized protein LOC143017595 n=1 Tax=Oratosquilla oratoria TaxID=337810 RepID=UPI003F75E1C1
MNYSLACGIDDFSTGTPTGGSSFPDSETPQRSSVKEGGGVTSSRPPLVRSRTLPAIVVPGVTILQAQIDTARTQSAVKRAEPEVPGPHQVAPCDSTIRPLLTVTAHGMSPRGRLGTGQPVGQMSGG